jgi:Predicted oxidoreductases (related to aryl-alcohol dehydrogenases)
VDYVKLGTTGLDVSPIAIGAMTYGEPDRGHPVWSLGEEDSRPLIKHAVEQGINFFDTANVYSQGSSEETLGRALRDFANRDDVVIATKLRNPMRSGPNGKGLSRKAIMTEVDHSLKRLGTDYIDLYQIHRNDHSTPLEETLEALHVAGQGRQGPLPRRLVDAGLGVREGAAPPARARLGPLRVDAGPLQPARPRGGARDDPAVPR